MTVTDFWKKEHQEIRLALSVLEKLCDKIERGERFNPEHLDRILDFMKVFYDKSHHKKEENVIFPALLGSKFSEVNGLIRKMIQEHYILHNDLRSVGEEFKKYKGKGLNPNQRLEGARRYISILRQHADREDEILCPMVDLNFSSDAQDKLMMEFERVDASTLGVSKHEQFQWMLSHLQGIYLA